MNEETDDFLAIDFETACGSRASACSVGFARFTNGTLTTAGSTLIDPGLQPGEWDAFNTSIHGIGPGDVVGAPSFIEAWSQLQGHFAGLPLVAHSASFDMSVIRAELARANVTLSEPFRYCCSAKLSRAAWPDMLSVSLDVMAQQLGFELDHHDAKSDAVGSGQVAVEAARALGCATLGEALANTQRNWGQVNCDLTWDSGRPSTPLRAADFVPDETGEFDPDHPLYGMTVAFTGTLQSMERREAFRALSEVGGIPGDGVTKKTNLLVVGDQDISRLASGASMSRKLQKAADLRATGQDVELIGETEFLRRL